MTGIRRPTRRVGLAAVIALALVAGACGSSSKTSSGTALAGTGSSPGTAAATTAGAATSPGGTVINIGLAAAMTGSYVSSAAPGVAAAKAWAAYVNGQGGINGHRVNLEVEDTASSPSTGLSAAEDLVNNKGAVAMLVIDGVSEAAIYPFLQQKGIPVLGAGFAPTIYGGKSLNVFAPITDGITAGGADVPYAARAAGAHSIGVIYCVESPACESAASALKPATVGLGLDFAGLVSASASAPSYTAECLDLIGKGASYIDMAVASATGIRVADDCRQQGYNGLFGASGSGFVESDLTKATGTTWVGTLTGFPWWVNDPPVVTFRNAMTKYAPGFDYGTSAATSIWGTLQLFNKALSSVPATTAVTPTAVISAYNQVKDEDLGGLLPTTVTYTAGQPAPAPECFWMYKFVAGQADPTLIPAFGTSGNSQTGDLATSCPTH